ncbi:adenylosuccinate lyase [Trueperella sp. LYQ143]|uniref:adenylosuccinate lyase n=1 Tax=Trueperella sp. LYQ143 TaxID=3391059 RepID=UPI0039834E50
MAHSAHHSTFDAPISPLDGRYRHFTAELTAYFSEPALNRARIEIEIEWMIFLCDRHIIDGLPTLSQAEQTYLRSLVDNFDTAAIERMAQYEQQTVHDVKAVEYLIKDHLDAAAEYLPDTCLPALRELVHLFATSEDVNNLAYALCVQRATRQSWLPAARKVTEKLREAAHQWAQVAMLARTHGQAATPTTVGKELAVFASRMERQLHRIEQAQYAGKFNGATGTFGAHSIACPEVDWPRIARDFVTERGLDYTALTTQIEPHDWMIDLYADMVHTARIAHNLATDMWTYISLGYFSMRTESASAVGSSTMPHKVNPIRFENAEANCELACAVYEQLAASLSTSRMQRDLSDSSVLRNIGVAFGYSLVAFQNLARGLAQIDVNLPALKADLDNAWEVLAEPIQQVLRVASIHGRSAVTNPYEKLKELTRGQQIDAATLRQFIADLDLPEETTRRLMDLTPASYTGCAAHLVE